MQAMALMWLHDEGDDVRKGKKRNWFGTVWCFFVLAVGTFIMIGGVSLGSPLLVLRGE